MTDAARDKHLSNSFFGAGLADVDPEIARAIELELGRQRDEIELIASENIVSQAHARMSRVQLQVERSCFYYLLLIPCEFCETVGEGVGDPEFQSISPYFRRFLG